MNTKTVNKFLEEHKRRQSCLIHKKRTHDVVGIEIKSKRKEYKMTLEALAGRSCSQSYLSKIENNKISPNLDILEEICIKSHLTKEDIDRLIKSGLMLEDAMNSYIYHDLDFIKAKVDEFNYSNYRTDILKLIYYVSIEQYNVAQEIFDKVIEYVSSLPEVDFIIFSIISGFLLIHSYRFEEAIKSVESLDSYMLTEELEVARLLVLFKASFALNTVDCIEYYRDLEAYFITNLEVSMLEELRYYICLYFLKNNSSNQYFKYLRGIKDEKYTSSLNTINCFMNNKFEYIKASYDKLLPFAEMLRKIANDRRSYLSIVKNKTDLFYHLDYDPLFVNYFVCKEPQEKIDYIFEKVLPILVKSNDNYLKSFYINELSNLDHPKRSSHLMKFIMAFNNEKSVK
ncbi:MAG: helix-turn-helix domain-containing protein [Acholeplasmatales bacterium]|nr:helix-turn-helix domain-containing protein [Acholeplasmatales bacterium]